MGNTKLEVIFCLHFNDIIPFSLVSFFLLTSQLIIFIVSSLKVMCCSSLAVFKMFSLTLALSSFA